MKQWTQPAFEHVRMNAEIGGYQGETETDPPRDPREAGNREVREDEDRARRAPPDAR